MCEKGSVVLALFCRKLAADLRRQRNPLDSQLLQAVATAIRAVEFQMLGCPLQGVSLGSMLAQSDEFALFLIIIRV